MMSSWSRNARRFLLIRVNIRRGNKVFQINENYLKLQGSYLFSTIAKKVKAYAENNPDKELIRLGIGDVTLPLAPAVIKALHSAVDEMAVRETFRGYAPDLGYEFLRSAIAQNDFARRGAKIGIDEIFISDGAKSDSGNIGEIFGRENRVAICDPVYPVYLDSNVMDGRAGEYLPESGRYSRVIYMPCTEENGFLPRFPEEAPDMIYLCFPNNPTGMTIPKTELQKWGITRCRSARSSFTTRLMKPILRRRELPTRSMSAMALTAARSSSAASRRTPALPGPASATRSFRRILSAGTFR